MFNSFKPVKSIQKIVQQFWIPHCETGRKFNIVQHSMSLRESLKESPIFNWIIQGFRLRISNQSIEISSNSSCSPPHSQQATGWTSYGSPCGPAGRQSPWAPEQLHNLRENCHKIMGWSPQKISWLISGWCYREPTELKIGFNVIVVEVHVFIAGVEDGDYWPFYRVLWWCSVIYAIFMIS